jgi:transposase
MSAAMSIADLAAAVSALQVELVGVKSRMRERDTEVESLRETIVNLTHENQLLKRRIYGNKTERSQTSELQLSLGGLFEAEKPLQKQLDQAVAQAKDNQTEDGTAPQKVEPKRKPAGTGRRNWLASDLPRSYFEVLDPELEKTAKRIGFEDALHLIRRRGGWSVLVKRTAKYEVAGKDGPTVLGVEAPKTLFPRGMLHSSVVAYILMQKFGLGVPHYRLEQHLDDQGIELSRVTMCRYSEDAGNALGATIVHAMWRDAIENGAVISTDATSALIQPERGPEGQRQACKKAHFFTAVVDTDSVLFAYAERHTQDFVKKLFGGFKGFLQRDAHNVYDILERGPPKDGEDGITLVGCWAHCRRRFFEAAICKYPEGVQGLMRIRAIYAADDAFRRVTPCQAEAELLRVLDDGRLPLDNTRSERSLRKIVVGRKAWMFYSSDVHAQAAAAVFSLIASCRLHSLDPEQYLEEVMRVLPYWPDSRYLELAPNNWARTRAKLLPAELEKPFGAFTVPPQ